MSSTSTAAAELARPKDLLTSTATSFFLGLLFSLFPYDFPLLWTSTPPADPFTPLESHYMLLANAPPLIPRVLHIVIGIGFLGFLMKLYRATESNLLFDGASLALYVVGVVIYITNIVRGLHVISGHEYNRLVHKDGTAAAADEVDVEETLTREDSLRVLSASHTILALVLLGILVFQAGQWYADRKEGTERMKMNLEDNKRAARLRSPGAAAAAKKRA